MLGRQLPPGSKFNCWHTRVASCFERFYSPTDSDDADASHVTFEQSICGLSRGMCDKHYFVRRYIKIGQGPFNAINDAARNALFGVVCRRNFELFDYFTCLVIDNDNVSERAAHINADAYAPAGNRPFGCSAQAIG